MALPRRLALALGLVALVDCGGGVVSAEGKRAPTKEQCGAAIRNLGFNIVDYARYPKFFRNDSFIQLAQAGVYKSPPDIEEYVLFADAQGSPYLDETYQPVKPGCTRSRQLEPTDDGLCQLAVYRTAEYRFKPSLANGTLRTNIGLVMKIDPEEEKVTEVFVLFARKFLKDFFTALATPQVRSFICDTLEKCPDAWKHSGLDTEPRGTCEARLAELPVAESDMLYVDGNSYGCRVLHGAFASKNDKHCPHISLEPMVDFKGKTKCSVSSFAAVRDLFDEEFIDGYLDFADDMGIPLTPRTIDAANGGSEFLHEDAEPSPSSKSPAAPVSANPPSWSTHALNRHVLDAYPRARCNDGMPAAYYSDAETSKDKSKRRALIYFQGGGVCYNESQCATRLVMPSAAGTSGPPKHGFNAYMMGVNDNVAGAMETDAWPLRLGVGGVLSDKASQNPLMHDWLHVMIPYCTSDFHIGDHCGIATNAMTDVAFAAVKGRVLYRNINPTATGYCGAHVVDAVLDHLLKMYPAMREMEQVVLFGTSAGGIAASLHADTWAARLPGTDVRVVADSAWFPATPRAFATKNVVQDSGQTEQLIEFASLARAINASHRVSAACLAEQSSTLSRRIVPVENLGGSTSPTLHHAAVGSCLLLENILPHLATPAWIVQSLYDVYPLNPLTGRVDPSSLKTDKFLNSFTLLNWFDTYAAYSMSALERSALRVENAHHRMFAPSCMMHGLAYNDARQLTKVLEHDERGVNWDETISIQNPADTCDTLDIPGVGLDMPWLADDPLTALQNLIINGTSAHNHMTNFLATKRGDLNASYLPGGILFADICRGINCNPSCDSVMRLPSTRYASYYQFSAFKGGIARVVVVILIVLIMGGMAGLDLAFIIASFVRLRLWADARRRLRDAKEERAVSEDDVLLDIRSADVSNADDDQSDGRKSLSPTKSPSPTKSNLMHKSKSVNVRGFLRSRTFQLEGDDEDSSPSKFWRTKSTIDEKQASIDTTTASTTDQSDFEHFFRIPKSLEICGLTFQVMDKKTKQPITILDDVTLAFRGKGMTAIMGASGCGKSTLLELIVGQRTEGILSGVILCHKKPLIVGKGSSEESLSDFGYVPQDDDASAPTLTGREVLLYCAELRMPQLNCGEVVARVEEVIALMGLQSFADTQIGTPGGGDGRRGISGGQRRRLTLASQLLHDPMYLMADEPTSGLDSATSLGICRALLDVAHEGHSIVLTIHQPRPEVFELFTSLVVMGKAAPGRGGTCVYAGSVPVAIDHFRRLAPKMPADAFTSNPADFIIDLICNGSDELQEKIRDAGDRAKMTTLAVFLHNELLGIDRRVEAEGNMQRRKSKSALPSRLASQHSSHLANVAKLYKTSRSLTKSASSSTQASHSSDSPTSIQRVSSRERFNIQKFLHKNIKNVVEDAATRGGRALSLGSALARRPTWTFTMVLRWIKVTAVTHGRMYLSDLKKGFKSYMFTNYLIYVCIVVVTSIVYWDPPESPSALVNRMNMMLLMVMMPQFGKVTTVEGLGNMVVMHRKSRLAGNEHGSHFAVAYALTQSFTPWMVLGTMILIASATINIPWNVAPSFILAALTVDAIVGSAFAAIVSGVPFELKVACAAGFAGVHTIGSGVIYAYEDMPPIFKWLCWVMPSGPALSLLTSQFALAYDNFECPEDPDGDRSGYVDGYCHIADGASILSALLSSRDQVMWVAEHQTETIAILICQYLFWRIVFLAVSMATSSKKSSIIQEPFDDAIIRLVENARGMDAQIDQVAKAYDAATTIQEAIWHRNGIRKARELNVHSSIMEQWQRKRNLATRMAAHDQSSHADLGLMNLPFAPMEVKCAIQHECFMRAVKHWHRTQD